MTQQVKPLVQEDYKTLDATQRTSEALKQLESSKDVVVVLKNGEYEGIVTAEQIFRHEITNQGQKIKSVYKSAPRLKQNTSVVEALRLLYENDLKTTPVFEDDRLIGIIHLNDVLKAIINDETTVAAADLMTTSVTSVEPTTSVKKAIGELRSRKVSRLPVVDHTGKPQGIVSVYDIVRAFHHPQERKMTSSKNQSQTGVIGEKHSPFDVDIRSIMVRDLVTASPSTKLPAIINMIHDHEVGSVLITDDKNRLDGILTRRDILRQLVREYQESDESVTISIATNIENVGRQELISQITRFVDKYKNSIGDGHITLHIKRQKQRQQGQSLLTGRLHMDCQEAKHHVTAEGYGPLHLTRNILRKLRTLVLKYHQDHSEVSRAEYLEHFNITSL